jgi:hypothetical protein
MKHADLRTSKLWIINVLLGATSSAIMPRDRLISVARLIKRLIGILVVALLICWVDLGHELGADQLEDDWEYDQGAVNYGHQDSIEASKEGNSGIHRGRRASGITRCARAVQDLGVVAERAIGWHWILAWVSYIIQVERVVSFNELKANDWVGLLFAVEAHKVKESNWALKWGLSDKRHFLAWLEKSAGIVWIKSEFSESLVSNIRVNIHLIAESLD